MTWQRNNNNKHTHTLANILSKTRVCRIFNISLVFWFFVFFSSFLFISFFPSTLIACMIDECMLKMKELVMHSSNHHISVTKRNLLVWVHVCWQKNKFKRTQKNKQFYSSIYLSLYLRLWLLLLLSNVDSCFCTFSQSYHICDLSVYIERSL